MANGGGSDDGVSDNNNGKNDDTFVRFARSYNAWNIRPNIVTKYKYTYDMESYLVISRYSITKLSTALWNSFDKRTIEAGRKHFVSLSLFLFFPPFSVTPSTPICPLSLCDPCFPRPSSSTSEHRAWKEFQRFSNAINFYTMWLCRERERARVNKFQSFSPKQTSNQANFHWERWNNDINSYHFSFVHLVRSLTHSFTCCTLSVFNSNFVFID